MRWKSILKCLSCFFFLNDYSVFLAQIALGTQSGLSFPFIGSGVFFVSIETTIDSHAVERSNTERSFVHFIKLYSKITVGTLLIAIHWSYSSVFLALRCVCLASSVHFCSG